MYALVSKMAVVPAGAAFCLFPTHPWASSEGETEKTPVGASTRRYHHKGLLRKKVTENTLPLYLAFDRRAVEQIPWL